MAISLVDAPALGTDEILRARDILAVETANALEDPETTGEDLMHKVGNLMIISAYSEVPSLRFGGMLQTITVHNRFVDGLVDAGNVDPSAAEALAKRYVDSREFQHVVYSLRHVPDGYEGDGIVRTSRGVRLDEEAFILSALARDRAA